MMMQIRRLAGAPGVLAAALALHVPQASAWEPWEGLVQCVDGALRWTDRVYIMEDEVARCIAQDWGRMVEATCGSSYRIYTVSRVDSQDESVHLFHNESIEDRSVANANRCVRLIGDNINDFQGDAPNSVDGCPEEDISVVVGKDGTDIPAHGVPCNDLVFDEPPR